MAALVGVCALWLLLRMPFVELPVHRRPNANPSIEERFEEAFAVATPIPKAALPLRGHIPISSAPDATYWAPDALPRDPQWRVEGRPAFTSEGQTGSGWTRATTAGPPAPLNMPLPDRPVAVSRTAARRWSADAWLFLREGGAGTGSAGLQAPAYGASQVGAFLRYKLAPASSIGPEAYLRAVKALSGSQDGDLAFGLAARPLPEVAMTVHIEARATDRAAGVEVRPAAFVSAGFDDAPLPFGASARGYAQAGWVGGSDATPFADGSIVAERAIALRGEAVFSAGVGLWGGAQRDAGRLDVGPSASLRFPLSGGVGRLTVDYRVRVAGNAEPATGAALTLSAGF